MNKYDGSIDDFLNKNFVKELNSKDYHKQLEELGYAIMNVVTKSDFEDCINQFKKAYFDRYMAVINMGVANIEKHEGYPPELRISAANRYRYDLVWLLNQINDREYYWIDFFSLLDAYKTFFEELVLDWYKTKVVHLVNRVNDQPTDELHQLMIQAQYRAESELLINSTNTVLPFYHERLTSLVNNLDKRRAINGGFDNKKTNKEIQESVKKFPEYFESDKRETLPEIEQPNSGRSRTKEYIISELETLHKNDGWKYAFTSVTDYNIFLNLLTDFFEYTSYSLPKAVIRLKIGCKTKFAITLNIIYKEFSEKPLKSDGKLFDIVRVLSHFEGLSDLDIYKAMTK